MTEHDPKSALRSYLQGGRDSLLWKLDDLPEYEIRRPLVPTGTNLLGLVKHSAHTEFTYFGDTFGRSPTDAPPTGTGFNADMWATAEESREEIIELYRRAWAHSDATIDELDLRAVGHVPHWPAGGNEVTLHEVLVHVIVDTQRHAGQADIIREMVDGTVGLLPGNDNMPPVDQAAWHDHRDRLQRAAEDVRAREGRPGG